MTRFLLALISFVLITNLTEVSFEPGAMTISTVEVCIVGSDHFNC